MGSGRVGRKPNPFPITVVAVALMASCNSYEGELSRKDGIDIRAFFARQISRKTDLVAKEQQ